MSRFIFSADLGQQVDPTAVAVLEVTTRAQVYQRYLANPEMPSPVTSDWLTTPRSRALVR